MKKTNYLLALFILLVISLGVYSYVFYSATRALGTLEVVTLPTRASLLIDGEVKGLTPIEVGGISLGFSEVIIKMEGYDPYSRILHFNPHQKISLHVHLSREDFLVDQIINLSGSLPRGLLVGENHLYLMSTSGELFSYYLKGEQITYQQNIHAIVLSLPSLGNGFIYGATYKGVVYSFCGETGEPMTSWDTGKGIRKILSQNKTLFLLHNDGTLSAWEEGELLWSYRDRIPLDEMYLQEDLILLQGKELLFLDPLMGTKKKGLELPGSNLKTFSPSHHLLYLTDGQNLYRVDLVNGDLVNQLQVETQGSISSLIFEEETIFLGTDAGELLAFRDGTLLWDLTLRESISFLYLHHSLLVGTDQRSLYLVDKDDGLFLARKALPSQITGLYPHQGIYYLALRDGTLAKLIPSDL